MILFLLLLAQAQPPMTRRDAFEPLSVRGTDLERITTEFQAVCLAKPFDRDGFEAAVRASSWKYEYRPSHRAYADDWRSAYADASFNTERAELRGLAVPQCNLLAATAKKVSAPAVEAAVDAMVRKGAPAARLTRDGGHTRWTWDAAGGVAQLHLMNPGPNGQTVHLSLQFWTPEWEARAPAILEEAKRRGLAYSLDEATKE
ncbi:MAG TPA: hypothetical protein VGC56_07600 [Allosphingosinicella sp.]|jgi:hypothetical protein